MVPGLTEESFHSHRSDSSLPGTTKNYCNQGNLFIRFLVIACVNTIISFFRRPRGHRFEALLAPQVERLYRLAYRFTGNRSDAEDLVQELLVRLFPRTEELAALEHLRPWLARALYNLFIDTVRQRSRDPLHQSMEEAVLETVEDPGPSPEGDVERLWLRRRLAAALAELNPDQRALLALHDMEGYTLPELTIILDTPIGTLKSRLHRARERLKNSLEMEPFFSARRSSG